MNEQCDAQAIGDDQPTAAAHVTFRTTPDGPSIAVGVPAEQSGLLVTSIAVATGIGGSVLGPYLMARALHMMESNMPWQLEATLIFLASLLPLAYFLLGRRRS
ncbi:hypothetical protein [Streptomyces griseorubiginosus]|uniref:hypothetical protein n=1 Tax=Streptomyces griseorubiginosus TaxID=67304 RepID=UPI00114027B4|nr:hypothetical protein [Streptomyces griseorubiginosus]